MHPITTELKREVARLAFYERKPLGRDTEPNACIQSGGSAQRFPAVIGRPEPRSLKKSPTALSAPLRLCASAFMNG